jgi:hypothetical protein
MAMVVAADRDRCGGRDMKILIFGGTGFEKKSRSSFRILTTA